MCRTKQGLMLGRLESRYQVLQLTKIEGGVVTKPGVQTIQKNRQVVRRSYGKLVK